MGNVTRLDERFWNRLLQLIEEGQVIPVVGSQLLTVGVAGKVQTLQRAVAERLLELYQVDPSSVRLAANRELFDAVSLLVGNPDIDLQNLYGDVSDVQEALVNRSDFPVPESIGSLSAISDFRLLVTLSSDDLLARALRARCAVNEILHSPNLPTSETTDLAADWIKRPGEAHLLYLFGKARSTPVFAIHEEDILEYAHNLLSRGSHAPVRFLGELQQRSLLLIGCSFPDWLGRFFIRLTNQNRLVDKKTRAWLVEDLDGQPDLTLFINHYCRQTDIIGGLAPQDFVAELHKRWLARRAPPDEAGRPPAPEPRSVLFFISYSRGTDLPAAEKLFESLRAQGVAEHEIWFDRTSIEPGQDFQDRILDGIRDCRYFLPLISSESDRLDDKYFRREWRQAIKRSEGIMGRDFVMPIIVDADYDPLAYRRVPREWSEHIDFGHAPGGVPDPRTRNRLTRLIREERKGNV